jgi:hypothetical protein
MTNECGMPR